MRFFAFEIPIQHIYTFAGVVFCFAGLLTIFSLKWLIRINEWISKGITVMTDTKFIEKSRFIRIAVGVLFLIAGFLCVNVVFTKSWVAW